MELSPLENAIEFVKDGIAALKSQVRRLKNGETTSSNQLTMKLQGILDAAVAGGLKNYEVHTYVCTYVHQTTVLSTQYVGIVAISWNTLLTYVYVHACTYHTIVVT